VGTITGLRQELLAELLQRVRAVLGGPCGLDGLDPRSGLDRRSGLRGLDRLDRRSGLPVLSGVDRRGLVRPGELLAEGCVDLGQPVLDVLGVARGGGGVGDLLRCGPLERLDGRVDRGVDRARRGLTALGLFVVRLRHANQSPFHCSCCGVTRLGPDG
jgi:hypothetical protein